MNPTLIQSVLHVADAMVPDAELLDRFARGQNAAAFEEIVRRHGPLVWAVCRQSLAHHADAEDAFQAVFLALVRGAGRVRSGQALPAWLHGVAVRVAAKARRAAVRRRQREKKVAVAEADRPVPDAAWATLLAAVHEEVLRLPDAERTAFVLCELEGVRQPDAAERLGWPLGTLSGRLCRARQKLVDQLTRRGIVPGVLAFGGVAGSAGAVPVALLKQVTSFPASAAGVSSAVATLARGLVEGTAMRTKLLAAAVLVAGTLGVTGGAIVLSKADAQGGNNPASGTPGASGGPPVARGAHAPGSPVWVDPGGMEGMMGSGSTSAPWVYKFIDLKNDDRDAFTKAIVEAGTQGWEFSGSERLRKGNEAVQIVLVFKKHKGGSFPSGMGMPGPSGGGAGEGGASGGPGFPGDEGFGGSEVERPAAAPAVRPGFPGDEGFGGSEGGTGGGSGRLGGGRSGSGAGSSYGGAGSGMFPPGGTGSPSAGIPGSPMRPMGAGFGGPPQRAHAIRVIVLKHATAQELAAVVAKVFPTAEVTADPRTNQLILRADDKTAAELEKLVQQLDVQVPKR